MTTLALSVNSSYDDINFDHSTERACGHRLAAGRYAESRLGRSGRPITDFIYDPPLLLDWQALGVRPVGVTLHDLGTGVMHVIDWTGESYYPSPADFVEEARKRGVSRRIAASVDIGQLTVESMLILVHPKAWIEDPVPYHIHRTLDTHGFLPHQWEHRWGYCPRRRKDHQVPWPGWLATVPEDPRERAEKFPMCAGLWWNDLPRREGVDGVTLDQWPDVMFPEGREAKHPDHFRVYERRWGPAKGDPLVPGATNRNAYVAAERPLGIVPSYRPAAFLGVPITQITVIRDPVGGAHTEVYDRSVKQRSGRDPSTYMPLRLEDQ